jgi:hypothetical protein
MRTMFLASALVASMALPASALTCDYIGNGASYSVSRNHPGASVAYVSHSAKRSGIKRHVKRSRSVYSTRGQKLGSDPDPRVRDQLRRDPSQGGNNL